MTLTTDTLYRGDTLLIAFYEERFPARRVGLLHTDGLFECADGYALEDGKDTRTLNLRWSADQIKDELEMKLRCVS